MSKTCNTVEILVAAATVLAVPASAAAQTVTFGNEAIGSPAKDFEYGLAGEGGPGRWQIVRDDTAEDGKALAQLSTNTAAYRFLVAIYRPVEAANIEITARFKPISGKVDRAGGVIVRAIDASNYYIARANATENNVRFYRIANGKRTQLATADNVKVASGQWQTLTLRAEGDRFTVLFNGKVMHATTDKTNSPGTGRVGLWTKSDSVTRFDRIEIRPPP
jgi:hypothetical protein